MKDIFESEYFDKSQPLTLIPKSVISLMSECLKDYDLKVAGILEESRGDTSKRRSTLDLERHHLEQVAAEVQLAGIVYVNILCAQADRLWEDIRKENSVLASQWPSSYHVNPWELPDRFLRRLLGHERTGSCEDDGIAFTAEQFVQAYLESGFDPGGLKLKWQQWAADNGLHPDYPATIPACKIEVASSDSAPTHAPAVESRCLQVDAVSDADLSPTPKPPRPRKASQSYRIEFDPPLKKWSELTFAKAAGTTFTAIRRKTGERHTVLMEAAGLADSKGTLTAQGELLDRILTTGRVEGGEDDKEFSENDKALVTKNFGTYDVKRNKKYSTRNFPNNRLKKQVERLEKQLKSVFQLEDDPIPHTATLFLEKLKKKEITRAQFENMEKRYWMKFNVEPD
jgi:hypothetical protein